MDLLRHIERWLGLAEVSVPSAAVTDDDTEAWGDLMYMRRLVDDLLADAREVPGSSSLLEDILDRSTLVEHDDYHAGLELWPDPAGELLRQWRIELDDEEDVAA